MPLRQPTEEQVAAFVLAAHKDLATVVELHQQEPSLLNARYAKFNETALEAAGHMGRREIAEYLIAAGAPMTIFAAAMLGDMQAMQSFLRDDPGLAKAKGVHGISVLHHVALSGKAELADLLAEYGDSDGADEALHAAVRSGHTEMVEWLLAHGVREVNIRDIDGRTPRQVAVERGYGRIAELLRKNGGIA